LAAAATAQLRIAYPPEGARVDLGLTKPLEGGPSHDARLTLKAEGGVLPLRWIVNGMPLGEAKGATDSVLVRLE
jgi:penicillin-binding protein 1C